MFADILKHLGRILQKMMSPVHEPMRCPRCHRDNALRLTFSSQNSSPHGWKCQYCNHVIAT
jgi:transposase-like protein